ncbi:MAG: hypothetical protein Q7R93_03990 [bacterium]|nr:hypothetical protein [bacterium]
MRPLSRTVFLGILLFPVFALAQSLAGDELVVSLSPARPGANTLVTVDVESYSADLSSAKLLYLINGKTQAQGTGQKNFSFRTGGAGSVVKLTIIAQTIDGRTLSKEFTLKPADVLLLWQSNGYTPPFYKGKALFPLEGTILVSALPVFTNADKSRVDPKTLIYTWKEDGKTIGDASGYGRSAFVLKGGVPMRTKTVAVEVNSADSTMLADASIDIQPVQPRVLLYENNPLYGIEFNRPLGNAFSLSGDEVNLSAIPFYFEAGSRANPLLSYSWLANYKELPNEKKPSISLRRSSAEGGSANVSVSVEHSENTFEAAGAALTILFEARAFSAPDTTITAE